MRILYVLSAPRHPALRGELRHYHFLRILGRRHPVTLVAALAKTAVPDEVLDELRGHTERATIVDASPGRAEAGRSGLPAGLARARRHRRAVAERRTTLHALAREFASGMQNKLLEVMPMELPVVTTLLAADGLRMNAADPRLRVGQCTRELAGHVIDLLRNADARRDLGVMGRAFVSRISNGSTARGCSSAEKDAQACGSQQLPPIRQRGGHIAERQGTYLAGTGVPLPSVVADISDTTSVRLQMQTSHAGPLRRLAPSPQAGLRRQGNRGRKAKRSLRSGDPSC